MKQTAIKPKTRFGLFFVISLVFFTVLGLGLEVANGEVLKIARGTGATTLDPAIVKSGTERALVMLVAERLFMFDHQGKMIPMLAESFERSDDMTVYTFKMRQGVRFSDGNPVNAEAVKYSFERVKAIGAGPSKAFSDVDKIEAVDDDTLRITLNKPNALFVPLNLASSHGSYVVSPAAYKKHATKEDPWAKNWANSNIVGSGPYMLAEFKPGIHTILTKNDDYRLGWTGKHVDKVAFIHVREYSTRKQMFQAGNVHIIDNIRSQDIPLWEKSTDITLARLETNRTTYIFFNHDQDILKDVRVRKAISYAFDYNGGSKLMGNLVKRLHGPFPNTFFGYKSFPPYEQNLEKAKSLLKEAGVETPLKMKYIYWSGSDDRRQTAELLKSNLAQIGIDLYIQPREWVTLVAEGKDPKLRPELVYYQTWPTFPDPLDTLGKLFLTQGSHQVSSYSNTDIDKWAEKATSLPNNEERVEICAKIQDQLWADVPCLFLWTQTLVLPMSSKVKNFKYIASYNGYYDVYSMYLE